MPASTFLQSSALATLAAAALVLAQQGGAAQGPIEDATTVSGVTISGMLAPVPKVGNGAPRFSPEDFTPLLKEAEEQRVYNEKGMTAITDCLQDFTPDGRERLRVYQRGFQAGLRLTAATTAARAATTEAIDHRRWVLNGQVTQTELEASELRRQLAVNEMLRAQAEVGAAKAVLVFVQELERDGVGPADWDTRIPAEEAKWKREAERRARNQPLPEHAGLVVESVSARSGADRKGAFLRVSGQVRNTRDTSALLPLLSVTALDDLDLPLVNNVARGPGRIAAGKVSRFSVELRPSPNLSRKVQVAFADREPPRMLSTPISCDPRTKKLVIPSSAVSLQDQAEALAPRIVTRPPRDLRPQDR